MFIKKVKGECFNGFLPQKYNFCIQKLAPKMFISVFGFLNSDINIIACKIEEINGNCIHRIKFLS